MTVIVESGAVLICWFLSAQLHAHGFIWNPDLEQAQNNWNVHSSAADEEIGGIRISGAKYNTEFPNDGRSCGSAYGDSFVLGAGVSATEGWIEQLSHLLGCRVINYAVVNYGTDQAYFRFREVNDDSPIVLLGISCGFPAVAWPLFRAQIYAHLRFSSVIRANYLRNLRAHNFVSFRKIKLASLGVLLQPRANPSSRLVVQKKNSRPFERMIGCASGPRRSP